MTFLSSSSSSSQTVTPMGDRGSRSVTIVTETGRQSDDGTFTRVICLCSKVCLCCARGLSGTRVERPSTMSES